ncbi:hypothetical protein L228DRAFT_98152 [Xylona heveae TC161]|uniref:Uncharacterized protein n=1 Tax=Xylona heveae (strain CBS 132557 / TC161) TaxID=1328760 RepID=A0A165I7J0_XYLHT|nr:hypothetical protein L228DRAFT_98152 [Xylona heveae TC161]KZF24500.1 hypothetical protein L228DRAFT_98152 [Xylona heveae TC161]
MKAYDAKKEQETEQAPENDPNCNGFCEERRGRKQTRSYSSGVLNRPPLTATRKGSQMDNEDEEVILFKGRGARRMTI